MKKTWIITGAARGFGLEISKAVLGSGDNVVATVRSKPEDLAAKLDNHPKLHVASLDITDEPQAPVSLICTNTVSFFARVRSRRENLGNWDSSLLFR
jgi:NAD(P)-dependent dehydrogenase (short-subunit alcohol dehydrogenase family)